MTALLHIPSAKKRLHAFLAACSLALLLAAPGVSAAVTEQLIDLVKPNGTTLRYLLTMDASRPPGDTGIILFTGGDGQVGLAKRIPRPGSNFLVRSRQSFARGGLVTGTYDPSPDMGALSDKARMSKEHADEVALVLADIKKRTAVRNIYLVGTSRGTISAAYLATVMGSEVEGVVLTSTLFQASRGGRGLQGFDFSAIKQPLLFVHHAADACGVTLPGAARALEGRYPVIWVEGVQGTQGDACGPFSPHGYLGRETATVRAIVDWILLRKLTPRIDAEIPSGTNESSP